MLCRITHSMKNINTLYVCVMLFFFLQQATNDGALLILNTDTTHLNVKASDYPLSHRQFHTRPCISVRFVRIYIYIYLCFSLCIGCFVHSTGRSWGKTYTNDTWPVYVLRLYDQHVFFSWVDICFKILCSFECLNCLRLCEFYNFWFVHFSLKQWIYVNKCYSDCLVS